MFLGGTPGDVCLEGRGEPLAPLERFCGHDLLDHVAPDNAGAVAGLVHQRCVVEVGRGQDAGHRAADAEFPHQCSRVDPFDSNYLVICQVLVETERGAVVAGVAGEFPNDKAFDVGAARLSIFGRDAVVADVRVGHRDDLTLVRRVGEHLLVASHAGVEHHLAKRLTRRAERPAGVYGSVFECKFRYGGHNGSYGHNQFNELETFGRGPTWPPVPTATPDRPWRPIPTTPSPRRRRLAPGP